MKLFAELLTLSETAILPVVKRFMRENGYTYKGDTMEELRDQHRAACKRSGRLTGDDISFCKILGIPVKDGKLS